MSSSTRDTILELVKRNPKTNATAITALVGVTRARVGQILRAEGIKLPHAKPYTGSYCDGCGKRINDITGRGTCLDCYMKARPPVEFICETCGEPFVISLWEVRYRERKGITSPRFCTHKCWGVVAGTRYGFVAHPENIGEGSYNAKKTHCKHGHPFDEANTYRPPGTPTSRQCRACTTRRHNEAYAKKKGQ